MFPKDIEETREQIDKAFRSLSWGLSDAYKAANLSGDPELIEHIEIMLRDTFTRMRNVGKLLDMQGWKPKPGIPPWAYPSRPPLPEQGSAPTINPVDET